MITRVYKVITQLNGCGDEEVKVFLDKEEAEKYFETAHYFGTKSIVSDWALID